MRAGAEDAGDDADGLRLKRRLDYFFTTRARGRDEVAAFARALLDLGPTAAVGGIARDLLLAGNRAFRSDVDFVVDPASMPAFERLVARHGGVPNRFGGHAMALDFWRVEAWPLSRTWAAQAGHARVEGIADVLATTFFDWDAVLYLPGERRVLAQLGYYERVRRRALGVNLAPSANPFGNAVRALRQARRWDATLSPALAGHVARQVRDRGWDAFVAYERAKFPVPVLGGLDGDAVAIALATRAQEEGRLAA